MVGSHCYYHGRGRSREFVCAPPRPADLAFMPTEKAFDKDDFMKAFEAYMQDQKANKRGRQAEKERFFATVKAMFQQEPIDYVAVYRAFRQAYITFFSALHPLQVTMGQYVVNEWAKKMAATFPAAAHTVSQEEHQAAIEASRKKYSGVFGFFRKPDSVMKEEYKPKKDTPFNKDNFEKAFKAYLDDQYAFNRGHYAEKKAFFDKAKAFFSSNEVSGYTDDEKAYATYAFFKDNAHFGSLTYGVGEQVVAAWADKVVEAYPDVVRQYEERKSAVFETGAGIELCNFAN